MIHEAGQRVAIYTFNLCGMKPVEVHKPRALFRNGLGRRLPWPGLETKAWPFPASPERGPLLF